MRSAAAILLALAVLAAGCGDSGTPTTAAPDSPGVTLTATAAPGWAATPIAVGVKPDLALDADGRPAMAYLLEDFDGFIAYADAASGWTESLIAEGYFYGPIGLAFDGDGRPLVAYHDHQDSTFQPQIGDLTVATRSGTDWAIEKAEDDGHDGWDSTITVGADGIVRAAGIDPSQFDSTDGVEYYELTDAGWEVTAIGSGPVDYEWNVGLAVAPDGTPALTYYDTPKGDLVYAERVGGAWELTTVAADGDQGRFSDLAFDSAGRPHVSFYDTTNGTVRYATRGDDGTWLVEDVASLDDVVLSFTGARRITSLGVGPGDEVGIVFSDTTVLQHAIRNGDGWAIDDVVSAGELSLGQLVSLAVDPAGVTHIAFFEVTAQSPLQGVVGYVTSG